MRALARLLLNSRLAPAAALLLGVLCANAVLATPAWAAKVMFGAKEYLVKIEDIDLKSPSGEALYLGYKYSHHAFIMPYRTTDDGYILGVVGQQRYYALDTLLIARLQAQKRLPNPLPYYSLSLIDYLFGYLLWFVVAGVAIAMVFAARKQRLQKRAVPFAEAGLAHHRAGNLDAAIAKYDKALEHHPKLVAVLMLRGDAYKARGEIDRAIADYSRIINADAKNAPALVARGAAFEAKRLVPRAIDDYTRAIKSSKAPVAYFMRANAYLGIGDIAAAIKDYTSAIDKNNDFAAAYQNRAAAHERMGRADLAQADQQTAARLAAAAGQANQAA
jgi:tetratricopeptide (TPR) repeat protein